MVFTPLISPAPAQSFSSTRGSVLVSCLLLLSLGSVVVVGLLSMTQLEVKSAAAWDRAYRTRLAALSGKEIVYLRLAADPEYGGDSNVALPDGAGTFDATVTKPCAQDRRVDVTGHLGDSVFHLISTAHLSPKAFHYVVTALGDFKLINGARMLGNVYAAGVFKGESSAVITGDVDLYGTHSILMDAGGDVVSVDGNAVPAVQGELTAGAGPLSFVSLDLAFLRFTALSQGQYYMGDTVEFKNQDLEGVVYLAPGTDAQFENVTIRGVLVAEAVTSTPSAINDITQAESLLTVREGAYLKLIAEPGVVEDVALLAPRSAFVVNADAWADIEGVEIAGFWKIRSGGNGVFTGPIYVNGKFACRGPARFQAPAFTRDSVYATVLFPDFDVQETGYIEP